MEPIRSFIAIELPDEVRQGLGRLVAHLRKAGELSGVKWVNPDSIHLTLNFLGDIAVEQTGAITRAMEEAVQGIPPFHLEVRDLGVFPNLRRVQVVWVGISGQVSQLNLLQQGLELALAPLGFAPESRAFTPHLTLARVGNRASIAERQRFGELIVSTKFEAGGIEVTAINLMKSQLTRQGAIYSRISSVRLKEPLPTATT